MKIFDAMQNFFESIGEYVKNQSNLFWIFLGAFLLVSVVVIFITSFAYECMLTKTVDRINKFLERNPRINDDNLVAFNNMMKAGSVPKTLRRQWQQFMLYREHPASYYMSFKHCVENPLRNSSYRQQMTVYKIVSYILVVLSFVVSTFMAVQSYNANLVFQDLIVIPLSILVLYWLISMVLDLIHSAISADLFQNYQYFEINMDKAMLTLPEFVDYEVLFSQDEIRRGIPVLFAYLQKRAIQEQQELEKARLKSVDHEKFDFDEAGLDGSLVLDRAMRETENYTSQRKKYMQEIERVNNEIAVLENNHREQVKDYQRQVQTGKETVDNLKEQLEQASSTIEINYIKKQMRDELNRQQVAEKDFDILTDKHNQEIKSLNQEIKHYEEEIKTAKDSLEAAMLSEFSTYSVKVYNNLEKIVDDKMQDKVDDYKDQIKGLEGQLEEKNEELENVYTRYQEVLSQVPVQEEPVQETSYTEIPQKKGKKKKKNSKEEIPEDNGMVQPEQIDQPVEYEADAYPQYEQVAEQYDMPQENTEQYDYAQDYSYDDQQYTQVDNSLNDSQQYDQYVPVDGEYNDNYQYANDEYANFEEEQYVPVTDYNTENNVNYDENYQQDYNYDQYAADNMAQESYPADTESTEQQYVSLNDEYIASDDLYVPLNEEYIVSEENLEQSSINDTPETKNDVLDDKNYSEQSNNVFNDEDFDIDFSKPKAQVDGEYDFDAIFGEENKKPEEPKVEEPKAVLEEVGDDFDINKILGLYDDSTEKTEEPKSEQVEDAKAEEEDESVELKPEEGENNQEELPAPVEKRKAGRPRKIVDEDEQNKPKRKPGRPRKQPVETEDEQPKRKAGRPRKQVEEEATEILEQPKRKAGRPRKVVDETEIKPKRKAGRPRKNAAENKAEAAEQPKRKAGRPRKTEQEASKRKVGRPRKEESTKEITTKKRKVGRPRKQAEGRKVGRPRKESVNTLKKPKGKRGRPRKN